MDRWDEQKLSIQEDGAVFQGFFWLGWVEEFLTGWEILTPVLAGRINLTDLEKSYEQHRRKQTNKNRSIRRKVGLIGESEMFC